MDSDHPVTRIGGTYPRPPPSSPAEPARVSPSLLYSTDFLSTVNLTGCPNHALTPPGPGYFSSRTFVTAPMSLPAATHPPFRSGKSIWQFSHFSGDVNRIGHQKLSTFRSISVPSDQTPVIQSQYKH